MVFPWIYFIIQGGINDDLKLGSCTWLITISGVGQFLFYLLCRYYSLALDDAKFVESLLEGLDDEDDERQSKVRPSGKINQSFAENERASKIQIESQDMDNDRDSEDNNTFKSEATY